MCSLVWSPVLFHFCFISPFSIQVLELAQASPALCMLYFAKLCTSMLHAHTAIQALYTHHTITHISCWSHCSHWHCSLIISLLDSSIASIGTECGKWEMRNGKFSHFSFPIFYPITDNSLPISNFSFSISQRKKNWKWEKWGIEMEMDTGSVPWLGGKGSRTGRRGEGD